MNNLKLTSIEVDLITALYSLQSAMAIIDPEEHLKRLEDLRYCEKVIEEAKTKVKELKACQDLKQ